MRTRLRALAAEYAYFDRCLRLRVSSVDGVVVGKRIVDIDITVNIVMHKYCDPDGFRIRELKIEG